MKTKTRLFGHPLALAALLCCAGQALAEKYTVAAGKGLSGPLAFVGVPQSNGIRLAVDELNAKRFLGDHTLMALINDDANDRGQLMTLMNRAAKSDNALMFLGTASSIHAIGVAPLLNELKMPMFGTAQSAEAVKASPWYFKITPSPNASITTLAKYAVDKLKTERTAVIFTRDNDGQVANMKVFRDYVKSAGKLVVAEESVLTSDTDFSALATKLAGVKADTIWIGALAVQAANIARQLKQAGVAQNVNFFSTAGLGEDYIKAGGAAVENTFTWSDFNVRGTSPLTVSFVQSYTRRFGIAPDNYAAIGYAEMMITAEAIKQSLPGPSREKVRDALARMKNVPTVLGGGTWSLDQQRLPVYELGVVRVSGGKYVAAP